MENPGSHGWLWWIPLLPLAGSAVAGALHLCTLRARKTDPAARGPAALAGLVACAALFGSLLLSLRGFQALRELEPESARTLLSTVWHWITVPLPAGASFQADLGLLLDPLSSTMTLVVTGVGFLIHVYSLGYMKGDPGYAKFFAFLNLFVFAMLMLVLSSSLLGVFIGWEGVGLCSYLLIGFWYEKGWPAEAGQKAFVMNRVGDACFLIGTFLLVQAFGTLDVPTIVANFPVDGSRQWQLTLAGLFLFGGCCGKSAQFPLFTWLPDAMAGPTPVSALIHAATMVTSGIYLVARLNPLYASSPGLLALIAGVGAATALIGGSTALVQRDIKKVLAYSTVSQLGYMFLGLGTGAFAAAIFHLVTHAFFKALLFLGAGSVIHGMHEEQDVHRMGGLRRHMPRTFVTFVAGAAALSGLPLLSGFFSKDEILANAFAGGGLYYVFWGVGLATAALTAFYTWRLVSLTFFGPERFDHHHVHPHESPAVMTVPLMVLALLSVAGGVLGLPPVFGVTHALADWLEPVIEPGRKILERHGHAGHLSHAAEWALLGLGSAVALFFAHRGYRAYAGGPERDAALERGRPALAGFLGGAWRFDALYDAAVVRPLRLLAAAVAVVVDQFTIDGLVNGSASAARGAGAALRRTASGYVGGYALWMGVGALLISVVWLWS
ncbi:MAG: NADH-quinone oxidoreductase subunit L [Planctomycetes bacterium]|nr:NADH-quinone oxidoreductase subunit L [Planctomycetota bacterium]